LGSWRAPVWNVSQINETMILSLQEYRVLLKDKSISTEQFIDNLITDSLQWEKELKDNHLERKEYNSSTL